MHPFVDFDVRERLGQLLVERELRTRFQPIVSLSDAGILGYEALSAGPGGTPLESPIVLFGIASDCGLHDALEDLACELAIRRFATRRLPGALFLNVAPTSVVRYATLGTSGPLIRAAISAGLAPSRLVLELTEHERVEVHSPLRDSIARLHAMGIRAALDDFGDGRSSMRLWAELAPDVVKLDRYFVSGIDADRRKLECVRAMMRLAATFGTQLVGEGVEREAELIVLRDVGVHFVQGYWIERPAEKPSVTVSGPVRSAIESRQLAVFPDAPSRADPHATVDRLVRIVAPVRSTETNACLARLFATDPSLHALAVVDGQRVVGLVNRQSFMDRFAQPYYRDLYGRHSCTRFMDPAPLVIERGTPVDTLTGILTGQDQRYLHDGFIVTEAGRYFGMGTGDDLVRSVTESRIEAARHANPLTLLPGNVPIAEHVGRLLDARVPFSAAYFDLNNFKPFNDLYGYFRGDAMIKLAAQVIVRHADPLRDFVGHVGGDDFVVLLQSEDWRERCTAVVDSFNQLARGLFDPRELESGEIRGEDRHGRPSCFPLTTICVGVVCVHPGEYADAQVVASAAAAAKRAAKAEALGVVVRGSGR